MVLPLLLRTLGQEDAVSLIERATSVAETKPELLLRAVSICSRLDLIDRLREERTLVLGQDLYPERHWREIDQLTAFLAATCIPIAEGDPNATDASPFQSFVASLPRWAQEWLGRSYMVLPVKADADGSISNWLGKSALEQCRLIAAHLAATAYVYPRSVEYVPWDEHDRLHMSQEALEAPFEFAWQHRAGDPTLMVETTVGIKAGLAESEALRFLLVIRLRNWMNSGDDESLVERYWTRRQVRVWSMRALKELEENVTHVHRWTARALYDRPDSADYAPIMGLGDTATRALLSDPGALHRFGGIEPQVLRTYLTNLDRINNRVFKLNQRHDDPSFDLRGKAVEEEHLFANVVAEPETRELLDQIQTVHLKLSRSINAAL